MSRLKKFNWLICEARRSSVRTEVRPLPSTLLSHLIQSWLTKKLEVTYQIVKEQFNSAMLSPVF
jgi:hypothetical protein